MASHEAMSLALDQVCPMLSRVCEEVTSSEEQTSLACCRVSGPHSNVIRLLNAGLPCCFSIDPRLHLPREDAMSQRCVNILPIGGFLSFLEKRLSPSRLEVGRHPEPRSILLAFRFSFPIAGKRCGWNLDRIDVQGCDLNVWILLRLISDIGCQHPHQPVRHTATAVRTSPGRIYPSAGNIVCVYFREHPIYRVHRHSILD